MGSVYARGTKLWIRYKAADGKWTQQKTSLHVGDEKKAHGCRTLVIHTEAANERRTTIPIVHARRRRPRAVPALAHW